MELLLQCPLTANGSHRLARCSTCTYLAPQPPQSCCSALENWSINWQLGIQAQALLSMPEGCRLRATAEVSPGQTFTDGTRCTGWF